MTFAAVVLWIKNFLASVPRSVYTHGLAFIVGVVLRGCLAVALVVLLASTASAADVCPVNGSNCTCGCQQGGQCNCALTRVAPERLTRRTGFDAYCDLIHALRPGDKIAVYVNHNPPASVTNAVRYDGYPNAAGRRFVVYGHIQPNGDPKDDYATYLDTAPVAYYQPLQRFGGNCSSGNCRSR